MGQNGDTYLYNNPLEVHGGVTRQGWYVVPCCPSNLSRTFADLGKYIYSHDENDIWIHQYISSETTINGVKIKIESGLPWSGKVKIHIQPESQKEFTLHLRKPSWNGSTLPVAASDQLLNKHFSHSRNVAEGLVSVLPYLADKGKHKTYDPRCSYFVTNELQWESGDIIKFDLDMSIKLLHTHPKVKGHAGKVAVTRGPLVYCLESVDNPGVDIFTAQLDPSSLQDEFIPDLLGSCVVIHGQTTDSKPLKFIPYFLWANRGESQMTVWVNSR
jgi:DUF1680 family protein